MRLNRIVIRRIRSRDGSSAADLNAALAINAAEAGKSSTSVSSHQRIVQTTRGGKTETTISESPRETTESEATTEPEETK